MTLSDPRHAVWSFAKLLVAVAVLWTILYFSAENYDETEIETIGWFAGIVTVIFGGHELVKQKLAQQAPKGRRKR